MRAGTTTRSGYGHCHRTTAYHVHPLTHSACNFRPGSGRPLERFLAHGNHGRPFRGEDAPDALASVRGRHAWQDFVESWLSDKPLHCTTRAARALHRFERDGRLSIGSRRAVKAEYGWVTFNRSVNWTSAPEPWKWHRSTQYRPDTKPRPLR